jgi:hypothetical protein
MQGGLSIFLALGFVALVDAPLLAQSSGERGEEVAVKRGWLTTLEEGKAQARKSGKPLMVVFRCLP